ncbi:TolC family protein [Chitinophaga deserti]|uniref:TolC family protein n=1 Tax=Chitinophaga deserti TaxID=2164099 RepID=UPI000D6BD1D6|nr:TolC family protein [Chitinophaga deserti]
MTLFKILPAAGILFAAPFMLKAQQQTLSLREALSTAASQAPALKAYREETNAAAKNLALVKNALVPELTAGYQAGYATYNNITGLTYPGLFLPISGPPSTSNTFDPVPGTVLSALLKWEPLTFGQRQAAEEKAAGQYQLAASQYNDVLFRQQFAIILTYLDAAYLHSLTRSYQGNIDRTATGLEQAQVLAREGLKPGIDTMQFQSVLAQAEMDLLTLRRRYFEQTAELIRLTGLSSSPQQILLTDTSFMQELPEMADNAGTDPAHPALQIATSRMEVSKAALKEIQREWRPRLDVWANAYARGSGVAADGTVAKSDGWSLSHRNYGAGVQLSFPLLGFTRTNIRKNQYRSLLKAEEARLEQTRLDLRIQLEKAQLAFDQNREIAHKSYKQTEAAKFAYEGLRISYDSGLVDYTRLMQAQLDLLRAEAAQAGATLQVWRSLLDIAIAQGKIEILTDTLK